LKNNKVKSPRNRVVATNEWRHVDKSSSDFDKSAPTKGHEI